VTAGAFFLRVGIAIDDDIVETKDPEAIVSTRRCTKKDEVEGQFTVVVWLVGGDGERVDVTRVL